MSESLDELKTKPPRQIRRLPLGNLILWLLLVPVVFGTLIFFSNLAFILNLQDLAADTRSLLQAQYNPWPYDEIPPINIEALIGDIQKDIELFGTPAAVPTIEIGEFLVPPTSAVTETRQPTKMTATPEPSVTLTAVVGTPTQVHTNTLVPATLTLTNTVAVPSSTNTATSIPPSSTPVPSATEKPEPTKIHNTPTLTFTPTPTNTVTPSFTPVTPKPPTFTPTFTEVVEYLPVRPIAENNGQSEVDPDGKGCLAYFGYRNDNSVEIDIPIGDRNHLSEAPVRIGPDSEQPTHFYTDRISPAFEVVWNNPVPFSWVLDGREAVAQWCNPPYPYP